MQELIGFSYQRVTLARRKNRRAAARLSAFKLQAD
jgi:hypothetical protein